MGTLQQGAPIGTIIVLLIGHGTFDGQSAKFNLVGPDMTSTEWADLLRDLPVDYLKIDPGIVLRLATSPVDLAKLKAIVRVARDTRRLTIAQCVEDAATRERLAALALTRALGIEYGPLLAALREFKGLPHRVEWVARIDGVDYFADVSPIFRVDGFVPQEGMLV